MASVNKWQYSKIFLNRTLNKPKSYLNWTWYKVPTYFKDQYAPINSHTYSSPIAPKIFNYRRIIFQDFIINYLKAKRLKSQIFKIGNKFIFIWTTITFILKQNHNIIHGGMLISFNCCLGNNDGYESSTLWYY